MANASTDLIEMPDYLTRDLDCELVIGLVGAVGSELSLVIDLLEERLKLAGYAVELIKISRDVIPLLCTVPDPGNDQFKRISDLMTAGNEARQRSNDDSVLALGVATIIYSRRNKDSDDNSEPRPKTAYVIDSLKRPEEVEKLRLIYPSGFVLIGVHSEEDRRKQHLTSNLGIEEQKAKDLIRRDAEEVRVQHGQRLNRTFHLADFFVRITGNREKLRCDIRRMVEIWFGHPFQTPTFDEYAMFFAFSAALRSADLSRQVGAVLSRDKQILSAGANDCPKAKGGLYWPERVEGQHNITDRPQGRDYTRGQDSNRAEQIRIIEDIVQQGKGAEFQLDETKLRKLLQSSRIRDLTEYGRVVHAEMEALLACARNGLSTVKATLYCTTFPCHNCAKHIVAAGVERVVYIEPYPKSKALQFHDDSICMAIEPDGTENARVMFEPFVGIGPRRFFDLFSTHLGSSYDLIRKDPITGKRVDWNVESARLRIQMKPVSYLDLELQASELFKGHQPQSEPGEKKK